MFHFRLVLVSLFGVYHLAVGDVRGVGCGVFFTVCAQEGNSVCLKMDVNGALKEGIHME